VRAPRLLGTLLLICLIVTSVKRLALRLSYEGVAWLHDIFAVGVIGLILYHIFNVNYYTSVPLQRWLWCCCGHLGAMILFMSRASSRCCCSTPLPGGGGAPGARADVEPGAGTGGHPGCPSRAGQVAWLSGGHSPFSIEEHPFSYVLQAICTRAVGLCNQELGNFTSKIGSFAPVNRSLCGWTLRHLRPRTITRWGNMSSSRAASAARR
jgi:predicted ferric reductase